MPRAIAAVAGLIADLDAGLAAAQPLNTAAVRQVRRRLSRELTDASVDVFDRESVFIERTLAPLVRRFPQLKVVMEHITYELARTHDKRRRALLIDLQRYAAQKMYVLSTAGDALGFQMAQPWLGNWGYYRSPTGGSPWNEGNIYWWTDSSKKGA